jgi:hypothetical protein
VLLTGADSEYGAGRLSDDLLNDAIPEAIQPIDSAMRAEHDEVCLCGFGDPEDLFVDVAEEDGGFGAGPGVTGVGDELREGTFGAGVLAEGVREGLHLVFEVRATAAFSMASCLRSVAKTMERKAISSGFGFAFGPMVMTGHFARWMMPSEQEPRMSLLRP